MTLSEIAYTLILYPIVQIIEISYEFFGRLFHNAVLSILGISFVVTILCLPLYIVAEKWQETERKTQSKLKKGIERIKSTFKGDEQYMILSIFYKENHYHPIMALRSSFGLLIQIPFFMAAYSCLSNMPEFQGYSFLFIKDLGKPDELFFLGNIPINILPITMTLINCIAGAIYTKGFPLKEKIQLYGMSILFLIILYASPSGLVIYWTMNNVFSLIKNIFYKLKNPLKAFYIVMSILSVLSGFYILFMYTGGADLKKRFIASFPLFLIVFAPIFIRLVNLVLEKTAKQLIDNNKLRTTLFSTSAICFVILTGLVIPTSIILSSVQEFSNIGSSTNPTVILMDPILQSTGIFIFWSCCIYFLFGKKIQAIIALVFSAGLICSIVNAFAFMGNYGSMNVTLKFIDGFNSPSIKYIFFNIFANVALFISVIFLIKKNKTKLLNSIMGIFIFAFFIFGISNVIRINKEYSNYSEELIVNKIQNNFEKKIELSSKEKNVIVFMLDRAESSYFEHILSDFPSIKDDFDGFTFYKNTISYNGHTLMASPALYGGYEYTPYEINKRKDELLKDKHNESLLVLPRIFSEQGNFDVTVNDLSWGNYSYNSDLSFIKKFYPNIKSQKLIGNYSGDFKKEFYEKIKDLSSIDERLKRDFLFVSFFRTSPAIFRPFIYYDGSYLAPDKIIDIDSFVDAYSELFYLNRITDISKKEKGSFIIITNDATHSSEDIKFLNLMKNTSEEMDSDYIINASCLELLGKWFNKLKEKNAYDNTKIIIIADHGIGYGKYAEESFKTPYIDGINKDHFNPLFLVKDFNSRGNLKNDNSFMTNADVPTFAVKNVIENAYNPFTNKRITSKPKEKGIYITIDDIFMPNHSKSKNIFTIKDNSWYFVRDDIFIDENWIQKIPEN